MEERIHVNCEIHRIQEQGKTACSEKPSQHRTYTLSSGNVSEG